MTILGGLGTIEGPVIGALFLVILEQMLPDYTEISLLIQGLCIIACALVFPGGIASSLSPENIRGKKSRTKKHEGLRATDTGR